MNSTKMDTSAVYALFEELKQQITNLDKGIKQNSNKIQQSSGNPDQSISEETSPIWETFQNLTNQMEEKLNLLNTPYKSIIRKEHSFSIDFKNSKAVLFLLALALAVLVSTSGNIWQLNRNSQLQDNDLKYRYVKMIGKASRAHLLRMENIFTYNRDNDSIDIIRKQVELYEQLVKEQAEKIEQGQLNLTEADRIRKQTEKIRKK